jgi:hypothetical protein
MRPASPDEWKIIESLLPSGWQDAARELKAFERARYMPDPPALLRLLLFHAVNDAGLRETVSQARAAGIADMSQVALLKRIRKSADWLAWIVAGLCEQLRGPARVPAGLRPRAVDSVVIQGAASSGTEWRLRYCIDLVTLSCDWLELADANGGEGLEQLLIREGDVLIADRNRLRPEAARSARRQGAHLVVRLRSNPARMTDPGGEPFQVLAHAQRLKVGEVGAWPVRWLVPRAEPIQGRVVATRLPAPLAERAERRRVEESKRRGWSPAPRSLKASRFVMLFATLPEEMLDPRRVLELYRLRWQIEPAFKRMKRLVERGQLPHRDPRAARGWMQGKLLVSLVLETLFRNARVHSPWGYDFEKALQ